MADKEVNIILDIKAKLEGILQTQSGLTNLSKQFDSLSVKIEGLGKSLTEMGKRSTIAFAGFSAAIGLSIAQSIDAEKTTTRLAQAIENQGTAFKGNLSSVQKYSDALAKKLRVDDDEVDSIQATLIQYGVQEKDLQRLTASVYDYAAATGTDATNAVELFKRASVGGVESLKKFNAIALNAKGSAEALANTNAGKLRGFQVAIDDLRQAIGNNLLPVIAKFAEFLTNVLNFIGENKVLTGIISTVLLLGVSLTGLISIIGIVGGQFLQGISVLLKFSGFITGTLIPIIQSLGFAFLNLARTIIASVVPTIVTAFGVLADAFYALPLIGQIALIISILTVLAIAFYKNFDAIKKFVLDFASVIFEFFKKLFDKIKIAIDFIGKILGLSGKKVEIKAEVTTTHKKKEAPVQTKDQADKEIADFQKAENEKIAIRESTIVKRRELDNQLRSDSYIANLTQLDLDRQINQQELDALTLRYQGQVEAARLAGQNTTAIEASYLEVRNKLQATQNDLDKKVLAERFNVAKTFFGNLAVLNKDFANVQKGIAVTEAIINTALGVAKAIGSAPFPINLPAIAFAAAQGAAQVATIQAQSFAVGATNIPQDQLANIHAGEMIIPKTFAEGIRSGDVTVGGNNTTPSIVNNNNFNFNGDLIGVLTDEIISKIEDKINERTKLSIGGILQVTG